MLRGTPAAEGVPGSRPQQALEPCCSTDPMAIPKREAKGHGVGRDSECRPVTTGYNSLGYGSPLSEGIALWFVETDESYRGCL